MSKKVLALFAFSLAFASLASAQVAGRLSGSVLDSSGAAIPGASVEVLLPGGSTPVLTTTTADGLFTLTGVRPESYDLRVSSTGFLTANVRGVKVDPAQQTALPPVTLDVAAVTQVLEVAASVQNVQTSNAEVSSTITNGQIHELPVLDRYLLSLVATQAGVSDGRGPTVINGLRTSFTNVTLDGINIQDNLFRDNSLNFSPNMLQIDQAAEITVSTSNTSSALGGGAAQVNIVSPSGGNQIHGAGFWYNRNNALAATDWFDNKDGISKSFLNQNLFGGRVSGPIVKDRLLYFVSYEAVRLREQAAQNRTILTQDARNGIFTYRDNQNAERKVNVLQAAGVGIDPAIQTILGMVPGPENINNFRRGDSREGFIRNTGGYSYQARDNDTRDNLSAKLDYIHSSRHSFAGAFHYNNRATDRNDTGTQYTVVPKVVNGDRVKLFTGSWRFNPSPRLTNEVRFGGNLAPGTFRNSETFGPFIVAGFNFDNPINTFRSQGRNTRSYSILDNASYVRGRHTIQFGYQSQLVRTAPFNDAEITPTYTVGIGTGNNGLTQSQMPGISATDLVQANLLLASLAGYVEGYNQRFNVTDRKSGFVSGAGDLRNFTFNNHAFYVQDTWKVVPRLSLNLGLRYDYFGVVDERDGLALMPVVQNGNPITTLLSNATLDFAGGASGRPFYNKDYNNFAPNVGLAWDVFGTGKTAVRGGYSIHYVNDGAIAAIRNNINTNRGLSATSTANGLTGRISSGRPPVVAPGYQVPRTFADNFVVDPNAAGGMPDPNLRTPYVQQWSFGIQQEIKSNIFEIRYVANHATKALRSFDYNQVVIRENGFLADFQRAQNNGNLARNARGVFDPSYNPAIPGSQPLPVFNQLASQGLLANATIRTLIDQGQVGQLANTYHTSRLSGNVNFYINPVSLGTNFITNYSNSTYNALQVEFRRRTRSGVQYQANYTFSKVLSDSLGDNQVRFEPFLDINNPKIERARAPFDLTHVIKGNASYELPIGKGHALNWRPLERVLSGWNTGGILTWQSGSPFSVLSTRGTLNRGARSAWNTVTTTLNGEQLEDVVGFFMTGAGPFFVNPSNIGTDGRGVGPDGRAPFNGQAFFNPGAGEIGALQRRMFNGPFTFNLDFSLRKITHINERHSIELRMDSSNVLNHPSFYVGDEAAAASAPRFNVNSTTFGRITSTFNDRRLIQLGMYYRF